MHALAHTLQLAEIFLPPAFTSQHQALLVGEHWETLANRLATIYEQGAKDWPPPPYFAEEATPTLEEAYEHFEPVVQSWMESELKESPDLLEGFAQAITNTPTKDLLLLLGQRITSASIQDTRAIPPTTEQLLASAQMVTQQNLTVAGRAWTKHAHRSPEKFWGEVQGGNLEKNASAEKIVCHILANKTWWNVFYHYKHELVYEARLASGHGVRWAHQGQEFIGFLEPFAGSVGKESE